MATDKKKRGRHPYPEGKAQSKITPVRLTPGNYAAYKKAAEKEGLSLSEWIRNILQKLRLD